MRRGVSDDLTSFGGNIVPPISLSWEDVNGQIWGVHTSVMSLPAQLL